MADVICLVQVESNRATLTWREGPASFEPYTISGMNYADLLDFRQETRHCLATLVADCLSTADGAAENVAESAFKLARAGNDLYRALFDPGAGQARQARQVRDWLRGLADQRVVDTLEVVVDQPWALPWNVVYDTRPDRDAFLSGDDSPDRWRPFWGLRYNLGGGRQVDPLRRMPLLNNPRVVMVVDQAIQDFLPEAQQAKLLEFCKSHELAIVRTKSDLRDALDESQHVSKGDGEQKRRCPILYWLSHATPEALILDNEAVTPRDLRRFLRSDDDEAFGGLAFLNACQTAEGNIEGSFLEALHTVGFAGMIGTEHQTIDQFASPLGLDFLEAFLDRGEPVGKILRHLRARVPLGLLYGTYCPPGIRVDTGKNQDSINIAQTEAVGQSLGLATLAPPVTLPLPDQPYRSLAYYDFADRALFVGRDEDAERFAMLLDLVDTRILVLHGGSGVGKSSFLRAAAIPFLEEQCLGYRFLRARPDPKSDPPEAVQHDSEQPKSEQLPSELGTSEQPVSVSGESQDSSLLDDDAQQNILLLRATNDLTAQLAGALANFCRLPYHYTNPRLDRVTADLPGILAATSGGATDQESLTAAMRSDPCLLGRILSAVGDALPFSLVLIIDQCEEVFTLPSSPEESATSHQALEMIRRTTEVEGRFKLILSLRTEYYGRLVDRLRRGGTDIAGIRDYLLTDFELEQLTQVICQPTLDTVVKYSDQSPREKYGFIFDSGLPLELARRAQQFAAGRGDSVLPLIQVICTQLYMRVQKQRKKAAGSAADSDAPRELVVITKEHLEQLQGVEGGLKAHVESLLNHLSKLTVENGKPRFDKLLFRPAIKRLLARLYVEQSDGSVATALVKETELKAHWGGRASFESLVQEAVHHQLLRLSTMRTPDGDQRYLSLGHDALAGIARQWGREIKRFWTCVWFAIGAAMLVFYALIGGYVGADIAAWRTQDQQTQYLRANEMLGVQFREPVVDLGKDPEIPANVELASQHVAWEDRGLLRKVESLPIDETKQAELIPFLLTRYVLSFETEDDLVAGTDGNVFAQLMGERRGEVFFLNPRTLTVKGDMSRFTDRNPFERGRVDQVTIRTAYVGELNKIRIFKTSSGYAPAWKLKRATVAEWIPQRDAKGVWNWMPRRRWRFEGHYFRGRKRFANWLPGSSGEVLDELFSFAPSAGELQVTGTDVWTDRGWKQKEP